MSRQLFRALSALILSALTCASPVAAETLASVFAAAYESNTQLASARAGVAVRREDVRIALSDYGPVADATANVARTWHNGNSADYSANGGSGSAEVRQPIFRGFRTASALKAARAGVRGAQSDLLDVENQILLAVATAYFDVARDRSVVALAANQVAVLARQLQSTQARFKAGDVTRTDVAQAQSRLAAAQAGRANAEAGLVASQESFRQLVGQGAQAPEIEEALPDVAPNIEAAIAAALGNNPMIASAKAALEVADAQIKQAKGALLPSADVYANLGYSDRVVQQGAAGVGAIRGLDTSVGVAVAVPLYRGGASAAAIRQREAVRSQRVLALSFARSRIEQDVRTAWEQWSATRQVIVAADEAVRANQLATQGARLELDVGSRTLLDVLDAEQELLDAQVTAVRARRDRAVSVYQLLALMGELAGQKLGLLGPESSEKAS